MAIHKAIGFSALFAFSALSLSACGSSGWQSFYLDGNKALAKTPPDLLKAEKSYRAAVWEGWKNVVPDLQYAAATQALGEVLMKEGKYKDAQTYLLQTASAAEAMHMTSAENIKILKLLETAYEQTKSYDQADQTQQALINLVSIDLSPFSSEYKTAESKQKQLKTILAAQCKARDEACCELDKADRYAAAAKALAAQPVTAVSGD